MSSRSHPRNWVEISRGALVQNLACVRGALPEATAVCAVVKADAYGHGAVECARIFEDAGAPWFAVTSMEEGARLRGAGVRARILLLAGFWMREVAELIEYRLTPAIWDATQVEWLGRGLRQKEKLPIHLKIESGMGRLGITPEQESGMLMALARHPGLEVEALFTHFSASEVEDISTSVHQRERFAAAQARFARALGATPWHLLNSAGIHRFQDWGGMMARSGLALYGYGDVEGLRPALTWKTRVIAMKTLPGGHGVGYHGRFRTPTEMRVATIAAGYADGYRRDFWPGAKVMLGGKLAPVIGNISMDMTTIDVSSVEVELGDEVVLLGPDFNAGDLAGVAGTIAYEVLCGISARVERGYVA